MVRVRLDMVIFPLIGTKAGAMLEISSAWSCVVAKFTLLNKHQKQKKTVLIIWFNIRKRWKNQRHYQAILYGTPCRETNYCYGISDPRVLQTYIHPCCKDEDVNPPPLYGIVRHEAWTTHCARPEAPLPEIVNSSCLLKIVICTRCNRIVNNYLFNSLCIIEPSES